MNKKYFLLKCVMVVIAVVALAGCSLGNSSEDIDYLAVKIVGQDDWSIIDVNSGEFVCENEFKHKPSMIVDDHFFVKTENGRGYECYDVDDISHPINSATYASATYFQDGVALVTRKNGGLSIIDTDGNVVKDLDKNITSAMPFKNGFAAIKTKDGEYGYVNTKGEVVVKPKYDAVYPYSSDGYGILVVKQNDSERLYTVVDDHGEKLFSFSSEKYEPVSGMINGAMAVKKNDKIVYVDKEGTRILDAGKSKGEAASYGLYDGLTVFANASGQFGLMNKDGEHLIRNKYDRIVPLKDGTFVVERDGKQGVVDEHDKEIIGFEYNQIVKLKKNRYLVMEGRKQFAIIDEDGKEVCKEVLSAVSIDCDVPMAHSEGHHYDSDDDTDDTDEIEIANTDEPAGDYDDPLAAAAAEYESQRHNGGATPSYGGASAPLQPSVRELHDFTVANNVTVGSEWCYFVMELWGPALARERLTEEDIADIDTATLRYIRNSIFARHAYTFQSADLMDFYSGYSWYHPIKDNVASELNQVELYNVSFIKQHE